MIDALKQLNFSGKRSLTLIRQAEAAECGLACIAMIAGYFGHRTRLSELRLRYPVSLKGSTLRSLIAVAEKLGMSSRPLKVELESLDQLQTPCVLHWGMNHFVVLRDVKKGSCVIFDPALGERKYTLNDVSAEFTGVALELSPTSEFKQRKQSPSMRLTDMWSRVSGLKKALTQMLLLSVIVQLFIIAAPFYMQLVVDEVLTKFDTDLLVVLAAGYGFLMLINAAATVLRGYVILYMSNMLGFQMVSNLFRHLLRLPMQWYEKRHVGDILSRFASTQPIRDLFTEGMVSALIDGLMAVTTLVLIFVYSSVLGFVVLAALGLYLLLRWALYKPLRQKFEDNIVAVAREQSTFIESVRGIQSIKIFGHEAERQSIWQNRYADVINSNVRVGKLRLGFQAANNLIFGIENTLVVYLGALAVVEGSLSVGMLFAFMAYKSQFVEKSTMLVERLIEFRLLSLHLERIADIGLALPEGGDSAAVSIVTGQGNGNSGDANQLEIENVSFRYADSEPWVLKDLSISVNKGEMVSIIGASGGGKSTLMKLILGLFEPAEGQVRYCGRGPESFGHSAYRSRFGTVMQDDALLAGSIADNICFFDTEPDLERIAGCAENAAIHADIMQMPMGYDSLVGDLGATLSAGQRQRVLLARALYREPEILILDEGTANLDAATELMIIRMLQNLGITRICVAHRQPIIMASDRILTLTSGSLHELDKRQLLAQPNAEAKLA